MSDINIKIMLMKGLCLTDHTSTACYCRMIRDSARRVGLNDFRIMWFPRADNNIHQSIRLFCPTRCANSLYTMKKALRGDANTARWL